MDAKPLIILTGPTAVGKTELSIQLAKEIGGEIISADSMQVYRYMDIGSAKVKPEEMQGVPHHLIDVLEPTEAFHIVRFQEMVKEALPGIYERGNIPIITGGTGFYIQAILYDIDFTDCNADTSYREKLEQIAQTEAGKHELWLKLQQLDPVSSQEIHENNVKRVIRALEFYEQTGTLISEHNAMQRSRSSPYNFCYFVLNDAREHLYKRIDTRVDMMLEAGLVAEVAALRKMGLTKNMVSMQGLGYKEILSYLDGEITLDEAIYIIKRDTRHFAKRQLTWFKREEDVTWLNKQEYHYDNQLILEEIYRNLKEKNIYVRNKGTL